MLAASVSLMEPCLLGLTDDGGSLIGEGGQVEEPTSSGQGGGGWGGEGYEKPSAASADLAFHRYAKRLQRKPDQCIRLGSALLWPKEQHPQLDRCATGGPV